MDLSPGTWIIYEDKGGLEETVRKVQGLLGAGKLFLIGRDWHGDYFKEDITITINLDRVNASMLEKGQSPYVDVPL